MVEQSKNTGFLRHVWACNNAVLPGGRTPFMIGGVQVGWLSAAVRAALPVHPDIVATDRQVTLKRPEALPGIAQALAANAVFGWRNEIFDVREDPAGPALAQIDRGAIPIFGIQAIGVHVNGLVRRPDGVHLWVARRARDKKLDPGKLDHIVAGGMPTGFGPVQTLIKEAEEEAAIPAPLATQAVEVASIGYAMVRPEGLRRDWLYCYDLLLPKDFVPRPNDGEVEAFELWPLSRAMAVVRDTDDFKFNVNLVLIDLFLRHALIAEPEATTLRLAL